MLDFFIKFQWAIAIYGSKELWYQLQKLVETSRIKFYQK